MRAANLVGGKGREQTHIYSIPRDGVYCNVQPKAFFNAYAGVL